MTAAILIPVVLFSAAALNTLLNAQREAAFRALKETANTTSLAVDQELSTAEAILRTLSRSQTLAAGDLRKFYGQARFANDGTDSWIVLLDEHGQQLLNTIVPFGAPLPPPFNPARIRHVLASGGPEISRLITGPVTRKLVAAVDYPVILPDGRRYVLSMGFLATHFQHTFRDLRPRWLVGIFDQDGRTVTRSRKPTDGLVGEFPKPNLLDAIRTGRDDVFHNKSRDDAELYTVLTRSALSGWTVAVGVPVAEIESSAKRAVLFSLLGCLAALSTGTAFAFVFARRLIASVTGAMRSAFSLGQGEMPAPQHARILELDRLHDSLAQAGDVLLRERESRRLVEEQNWHRAHHDMLTGLPNRSLFRDRLEQQVDRARCAGQRFSILFIDLDRFKEVNDLLGHDAGDLLLRHAAERIRSHVRQGDMVARLGGDEFTVIVGTDNGSAQAEAIARGILHELGKPFHIGQEVVHVSGSIGITSYPDDATEPDDLVRNADQAMYTAKNAGRNRVYIFDKTMRESALQRLNTIADLRNALAGGQFRLYFQPIVDLKDGSIMKAEALLRWFHPERGLIPPNAFIPLAEETGLINEIGNWVFTEAAARALRWGKRLGRPFQISINKSPVQFLDDTHTKAWPEHLSNLGLAGHCLSIEITEGLLLNASQSTAAQLDRIEQAGINVAIDDFGTGYSSMSYLKKFKVDSLKIDQFFVQDMTSDGNSRTIAETIIVMAHKLGLDVVAEGVETAAQRDWLAASGCDYAQGFFFSEPLPADAFEELLLSQAAHPLAAASAATRGG